MSQNFPSLYDWIPYIFWDVNITQQEDTILRLLNSEDGGSMLLQNDCNYLPVDTLWHPRRLESSSVPMSKPQSLQTTAGHYPELIQSISQPSNPF
jgi:hypothetical protein